MLLIPAKKINVKSTYRDNKETSTHTLKKLGIIHDNPTKLNESVPSNAIQDETTITNDSVLSHRRDASDFVDSTEKGSGEPDHKGTQKRQEKF